MQQLTIFKILTFILVPFAILFGLMDIILLLSALANPTFLFAVFLVGGFCIYVFASLFFITKHVKHNMPAPASTKDWIRVNAFVSLFFSFMFLMNSLSMFYMGDAELKNIIDKFLDTQSKLPAEFTPALFVKLMRSISYFFFFFSLILLAHLSICFKLLKQYAYLFLPKDPA
ncbi:MAG: hypothetical protein WCG74_06205 [Sediminibacterium sp.]